MSACWPAVAAAAECAHHRPASRWQVDLVLWQHLGLQQMGVRGMPFEGCCTTYLPSCASTYLPLPANKHRNEQFDTSGESK